MAIKTSTNGTKASTVLFALHFMVLGEESRRDGGGEAWKETFFATLTLMLFEHTCFKMRSNIDCKQISNEIKKSPGMKRVTGSLNMRKLELVSFFWKVKHLIFKTQVSKMAERDSN